jgi:hypothetical protein
MNTLLEADSSVELRSIAQGTMTTDNSILTSIANDVLPNKPNPNFSLLLPVYQVLASTIYECQLVLR